MTIMQNNHVEFYDAPRTIEETVANFVGRAIIAYFAVIILRSILIHIYAACVSRFYYNVKAPSKGVLNSLFFGDNSSPSELRRHIISPSNNSPFTDSPWAVVTGATDGIGYEFAKQLYELGWNVCIVGRSDAKLASTRNDMELACYGTKRRPSSGIPAPKIAVFRIDLASTRYEQFSELSKFLDTITLTSSGERNIRLLINNAGASYDLPDSTMNISDDVIKNIITLNCLGTTRLTTIVADRMSPGLNNMIVNVSSATSLFDNCCPNLNIYASSKSYLNSFSNTMKFELNLPERKSKSKQIMVCLLTPFGVVSKLSGYTVEHWNVPSPEIYVRNALHQLTDGETTGFWAHSLMVDIIQSIPSLYLRQNLLHIMFKSFADAVILHRMTEDGEEAARKKEEQDMKNIKED